jgi:hypothetical protein
MHGPNQPYWNAQKHKVDFLIQTKPNTTMKYLPTINLWETGIQEAILCGQLKLQCGQWVKCGGGKPSRFVKAKKHSLWVAHPQGSPQATRDRFNSLRSIA